MKLTKEQEEALAPLNARQRGFVLGIIAHGNATRAAESQNYSAPAVTGSKLLRNPKVVAALSALRKPRELAALSTREERLAFFASVFRDERQSTKDRLKAAELAAKAGGDFVERLAISGDNERPAVQVTLSREEAVRLARRGSR